jgi:ATP phosphoribosyltransferase regulatory subunit
MSTLAKIPAGVQYFFDAEARLRRDVERRSMKVFEGWSYDEIILPMFDYHDLFARGMGAGPAERTYRFVDRDGALLALRPELTSLVARTVATRFLHRPRPIRLCYSGEVFRYDEPNERAAREFHQLGIEHIGQTGIDADIEILLVAADTLEALGITDFRIALSHAGFLNGVSDYLEFADDDRSRLRELIDRRASGALEEFLEARAPQIEASRRGAFCRLTQLAGKEDALQKAKEVFPGDQSLAAIDELATMYTTLAALGLEDNFDIDFGDAGELEYYTGLTFTVFVPELGIEIGGGGRYDNLIGNFGASEAAVGFSLSLDALAGLIGSRGDSGESLSEPGSAVLLGGERTRAFRDARELRKQGKKVRIEG